MGTRVPVDVGVLGSLRMGGHRALQKGGRGSGGLCAWEALQRRATGDLHMGEQGSLKMRGHRALRMKGQGSQQNRGTGMLEGRREHRALKMGAQESLQKWGQGSLWMR